MTICEKFLAAGEYYAAGFFEAETRGTFYRKALAMRRFFEQCPLPPYHGETVYPCEMVDLSLAVRPVYYFDNFQLDEAQLREKDASLVEPMLQAKFEMFRFFVTPPHGVFANMSNHSVPCYERVLAEGLVSYEDRVRRMQNVDMRDGLLGLIDGIRCYHTRCVA